MRMPLLVPCDGPPDLAPTLASALASGADALVVDLGPSDPDGGRDARRAAARGALSSLAGMARAGGAPLPLAIVRLGPFASGDIDADLAAVMPCGPDALLLRGAVGAWDIQRLAAKLAVHEAEAGLMAGATGILAAAADTPAGVLALAGVPGASPRLRALVWDGDRLAAALGTGATAQPCRQARGLLRLAAAAAGVPAFDTAPNSGAALAARCRAAARDGFAGLLASRPADVAAIARLMGRPTGGGRGAAGPVRDRALTNADPAFSS